MTTDLSPVMASHTIKALVKRGVVRETGREAYPTRVEAI